MEERERERERGERAQKGATLNSSLLGILISIFLLEGPAHAQLCSAMLFCGPAAAEFRILCDELRRLLNNVQLWMEIVEPYFTFIIKVGAETEDQLARREDGQEEDQHFGNHCALVDSCGN